jgi:hypothetical protein
MKRLLQYSSGAVKRANNNESNDSKSKPQLTNKDILSNYIQQVKATKNNAEDGLKSNQHSQARGKLALLFIIINELPFEAIWKDWIGDSDEVNVYIHAKEPGGVSSNWLRMHLINAPGFSPRRPAEWGSIELTKTSYCLLQAACRPLPHLTKHPANMTATAVNNTRFVFLSESCIPLVPLRDCLNEIHKEEKSWIKIVRRHEQSGYNIQRQFMPLEKHVPVDCVLKCDQWTLLTRKHAEQIFNLPQACGLNTESSNVNSDRLWSIYHNMQLSDEMFTGLWLCLANGGSLSENEIKAKRCTFVVMSDTTAHPLVYDCLDENLLRLARVENGALFVRKMNKAKPAGVIESWRNLVLRSSTANDSLNHKDDNADVDSSESTST